MKTIIFDMYGVIMKESKGNFIPYTYSHFPVSEHERITNLFKVDKLFTKAGNGDIDSFTFLSHIGFSDPIYHMRDYIENHLTIDKEFYDFAFKKKDDYQYALCSNDVSDWSKYITDYHDLNKYFTVKIVSANVHYRKPDTKIFELTLQKLGLPAKECIFVDNSTENLRTADRLGMDTILFNRDGETYDGKIVYSFDELSRIV